MEPRKYESGCKTGFSDAYETGAVQNTTKKQELKNIFIYAATTLMIALTVVSFAAKGIGGRTLFTGGTVADDYNEGNNLINQELLTEEIRDYFKEANIDDFISEEDMNRLVAEITTGVLNSLPQDVSDAEKENIREVVNESIKEIVKEQNEKIETVTGENKTIITEELKQYIKDTIVPNITAMVQINTGDIDDLKKSLEATSQAYTKDKEYYNNIIDSLSTRIYTLESGGASDTKIAELKALFAELSGALDSYKSSNSAEVTDLGTELRAVLIKQTALETKLEEMSTKQLEEFRQSLQDQIDANSRLSAADKREMLASINQVTADTSKSIEDVRQELEADIRSKADANTVALNTFINSLYGDAAGDVTIAGILEQIEATADLTNEQKNMLIEMMNEKYADVAADTTAQLNDVKADLTAEVSNRNTAIDAAVSSLTTSVDAKVAVLEEKVQQLIDSQIKTLQNSLLAQIEVNKNLSDEQKAALQEEINNLAGSAATAEELGMAVSNLTAQIAQSAADNQAALTDAINNLLGDGATSDITIAELESRIAAADISPEQKQELLDAISSAYADATADTSLKVGEVNNALQEEIANRTNAITTAVSSLQTELEKKLAELEIKVTGLIDSQIKTLENSLLAQIKSNKDLSDEQKAELERKITNLASTAASSADLSAAVTDLMAEIAQSASDSQAALNEAINNLLGAGATENITIAELEQRIDAADISPEQKQELLDAISSAYADATADTTLKVGEVNTALQQEVANRTVAITGAVGSLKTELEGQISNLSSQITANKNAQDQINTTMQSQIDSITNSLSNGCQVTYNADDGHFYITNADGTVSKKLDFAQ